MLGELVVPDPPAELPVDGTPPLVIDAEEYEVGVTPDVVMEVKVSGQTVVETATTDV